MPADMALKLLNATHRLVQRLSRGRLGWGTATRPMVQLTTTGRRSGQPHTVQLPSPIQQGDMWVVVASRGGDDRHPAWCHNVRTHPEVMVAVRGGPSRPMWARVATEDERARLWPQITVKHRNYARYQDRTERQIPLVLLTPR